MREACSSSCCWSAVDSMAALHSLNLLPAPVDESLLLAWEEDDCVPAKLVSTLRERSTQAAKIVPNGTLVRRCEYSLQIGHQRYTRDLSMRGWRRRRPADNLIGGAEMLLVRAQELQSKPPCRICMDESEEGSFDDDDLLNQAVMTALVGAQGNAVEGGASLSRGRLLRDSCACRGSAAAVHEGCLALWMIASHALAGDSHFACRECQQPFVGRAALVLARLKQRLKLVEAAMAAEHASQMLQRSDATPSEAAQAALEADLSAFAELEARHNEAVNVWRAGRYIEAANSFSTLLDSLETTAAATAAAVAAAASQTEADARAQLVEARHHLELSTLHNLGLALSDCGQQPDHAASYISRASAGFELKLGAEHPNSLKCLHNVAMLTAAAGKLEEAASVYEQALDARRRHLGHEHPDTLKVRTCAPLCDLCKPPCDLFTRASTLTFTPPLAL